MSFWIHFGDLILVKKRISTEKDRIITITIQFVIFKIYTHMGLFNKIKWILGIILVLLVVLATNMIDKRNFSQIRDAVGTIYEDRLVAKDIIYEITLLIKQKELAIAKSDYQFFISESVQDNKEIDEQVQIFEQTRLTTKEVGVFESLKGNLSKLYNIEANIENQESLSSLVRPIELININLRELSNIQMAEGKRQVLIGKKTYENVNLYTQMEFYLLIFLAIVIQVAVMYQPKPDRT
jgi:hypothetical protein